MILKQKIIARFLLLFLFMAGWLHAGSAQSAVKLKPLGQAVIPYDFTFKNTPVGGLSGLTYDTSADRFYVISDDRSQGAAARFYTFRVKLNVHGKLTKKGIEWEKMQVLKKPDGKPYSKGMIDPEGIAMGPDHFVYVSSEGDAAKNIAPFINGYSTDGGFARALTIPKAFWEKGHKNWGVRTNLAFEGLTTSPNASTLYAATENALEQDGPAADRTHGSPSRILVYDLPSGYVVSSYEYKVDSIRVSRGLHGKFMVNGLSDILALDDAGHLLTIERNYVQGQGNKIRLYEITTKGATDIKDVKSLQQYDHPVQPVQKKLVAKLDDFDISIDNFEGLALGPQLSGGGRLLLMVSDNNFSRLQQTIVTAFALF